MASGRTLDIGCGEKPYLQYFNEHCQLYIGIDLPFSPLVKKGSVDIFANALKLPFKKDVFDTIVCFEVLDDVPEPGDLFSEINRALKKEGVLILSAPQMWNIHNAPYDYYRYTRYGLQYQAEKHGFEVIKIIGVGGFWGRIAVKLFRFLLRFGRNTILKRSIEYAIIPFQFIFCFMDTIMFSKGDVICNLMISKKITMVDHHNDRL